MPRWKELAEMDPACQGKNLTEIAKLVLRDEFDTEHQASVADILATAIVELLAP